MDKLKENPIPGSNDKEIREVNRSIGYIVIASVVLILLLVFQVYWVIGNQLTTQLAGLLQKQVDLSQQLSDNQMEISVIEIRYQQNEIDSGNYNPSEGFNYESTTEWQRDTLENMSERARLETELEAVKSELDRSSEILLFWSYPWSRLIERFEKQTILGDQTHNDKYASLFDLNDEKTNNINGQIAEIANQARLDENGSKTAEKLNKELQPQLDSIDAQLANLYTNNNDLRIQVTDRQGKIDSIDVQINAYTTNSVENLKTSLKNQVGVLEGKAKEIQNQIDGINKRLTSKEEIDANIKSDLENQSADLNKQAAGNHDQIVSINNQLENLESSAANVVKELKGQKTDLQKQKSALDDNKLANEDQIQNLLSQRQDLVAQLVSKEKIVSQRNQDNAQLNQELEKLDFEKKSLERNEQTDNNHEKSRQAQLAGRFVLDILQGYLLPLLYGVLGAATYVLRDISRQRSYVTYSNETGIQHMSRISLGALAGIMVGWFTFLIPNESTSFLGSVSPLALAFLVGYNIELFFQLMDVALKKVREMGEESAQKEKEENPNAVSLTPETEQSISETASGETPAAEAPPA
jgi:chromosome segregation ATPase